MTVPAAPRPRPAAPPRHRARLRLLASAGAAWALVGCAGGPVPGRAACVPGSFWQPLLADLERPLAQWRTWVAELARLGVRRLVIQHVALEPHEVLVPRDAGAGAGAPHAAGLQVLAQVLGAAQRHGIEVWLGLSVDPAYHQRVSEPSEAALQTYLHQRRDRTLALADALRPVLQRWPVRGWYIGDEIDDLHWVAPARARRLGHWLAETSAGLKQVAPRLAVAISGFVNAQHTSPAALAAQWRRWFEAAPLLDEVLFQDGVGAGKVALADAASYLQAVAEVAAAARRRCTPVVELFEADEAAAPGPAFRSAPPARVQAQIRVAQAVATDWVAFSAPEYLLADRAEARALRAALGGPCTAAPR